MADNKDTLAARRWFRRRLEDLGTQYPHLKQPAQQERLRDALDRRTEEDTLCHAHLPVTPEDGPQAPGN